MAAKKERAAVKQVESDKEFLKIMRGAFGDEAIQQGDDITFFNLGVIPTGSTELDNAIGIGGIPRGRLTEFYGTEYCGKTTIGLSLTANAQKLGIKVLYIDGENAIDKEWAKKLGVNTKEWYLSQPDDYEQALNIARKALETGYVGLVIFDSLAMASRSDFVGDAGDTGYGMGKAKLNSSFMPILSKICRDTGGTIFFTQQAREKIATMPGRPPSVTTSGGRALRHSMSVRVAVSSGYDTALAGKATVVNYKVVKNRVGPPFASGSFIIGPQGIDNFIPTISVAIQRGVINRINNVKYALHTGEETKGLDNVKAYYENDPAEFQELLEKLQESFASQVVIEKTDEEIEDSDELEDDEDGI